MNPTQANLTAKFTFQDYMNHLGPMELVVQVLWLFLVPTLTRKGPKNFSHIKPSDLKKTRRLSSTETVQKVPIAECLTGLVKRAA